MNPPIQPTARARRAPLRVGDNDLLLRLAPHEHRRLQLRAPKQLEVLRGRAWITVCGEPEDRFPSRGERVALSAGSEVLVSGDSTDRSTLLRLVAPDPLPSYSASPLARLAGRLSWAGR